MPFSEMTILLECGEDGAWRELDAEKCLLRYKKGTPSSLREFRLMRRVAPVAQRDSARESMPRGSTKAGRRSKPGETCLLGGVLHSHGDGRADHGVVAFRRLRLRVGTTNKSKSFDFPDFARLAC